MKRIPEILLIIFITAFVAKVQAQESVLHYEIPVYDVTDTWHQFYLPEKVFGKIKPDLSDVRILRKNNDSTVTEVPYLFSIMEEKKETEQVEFQLVNQTYDQNTYYYTYLIPPNSSVSELKLDLGNQNFDWRVSVKGSHDQQHWFTIVEDYRILSLVNENVGFSYSDISFPPVLYSYLRVEIEADTQPILETSYVTSTVTDPGKYRAYHQTRFNSKNNEETKTTEVLISLNKELPVSNLTLRFNNNFQYYRPVSVSYLRDSIETEKGIRYQYNRIKTHVFNSEDAPHTIHFDPVITSGLRLVIRNYDNPTLVPDSVNVSGPLYKVTARFDVPGDYILTYGNTSLNKPNYDLTHFRSSIPEDISILKNFGPEQVVIVPAEKEIFSFLNKRVLVWLVIILAVFILGGFSLKMMKSPT